MSLIASGYQIIGDTHDQDGGDDHPVKTETLPGSAVPGISFHGDEDELTQERDERHFDEHGQWNGAIAQVGRFCADEGG